MEKEYIGMCDCCGKVIESEQHFYTPKVHTGFKPVVLTFCEDCISKAEKNGKNKEEEE